jgi:hypothetical protein
MRNTVFQSNDWKVFLEGVEIPFISINVSSGKNGELSGSVEVQSSLLLMGLSPYAAIAIFFRDRAAPKKQQQSDVIERDYVLFAEGSVYEISTSKSADQRNTSLSFRGHLDTLIRHKKETYLECPTTSSPTYRPRHTYQLQMRKSVRPFLSS